MLGFAFNLIFTLNFSVFLKFDCWIVTVSLLLNCFRGSAVAHPHLPLLSLICTVLWFTFPWLLLPAPIPAGEMARLVCPCLFCSLLLANSPPGYFLQALSSTNLATEDCTAYQDKHSPFLHIFFNFPIFPASADLLLYKWMVIFPGMQAFFLFCVWRDNVSILPAQGSSLLQWYHSYKKYFFLMKLLVFSHTRLTDFI